GRSKDAPRPLPRWPKARRGFAAARPRGRGRGASEVDPERVDPIRPPPVEPSGRPSLHGRIPMPLAPAESRRMTASHATPQSRPQDDATSGPPFLAVLLPVLASSALLWLCFFPVAWGFLAWVALVPWLTLVRSPQRPWRLYLAAW